jgi:hypothetical protein
VKLYSSGFKYIVYFLEYDTHTVSSRIFLSAEPSGPVVPHFVSFFLQYKVSVILRTNATHAFSIARHLVRAVVVVIKNTTFCRIYLFQFFRKEYEINLYHI